MRRRFQRARDPDLRSFYRTQYASAFAAYKQHIRRAKDAADRALCQDMTARNLYGSPFKLAFEKLHSATLLPPLETSPNVLTSSVLAARVDRQRRQFKGDPYVTYVDVAAYPAGGLFVAAAVNGRDNSLSLAVSVRAETPAAAETIAVALVIKQHDRHSRPEAARIPSNHVDTGSHGTGGGDWTKGRMP
ncbi:hypothetical protein HPB49_002816 [Dermacentor silvarum]|uniref:Uncharacterized protein n=1 Tax=Dermacentor silvarum TaxID=543639 RepID=A0ACB8DM32_DERSI|nr:hypothetical protein HPB49_002816 [Dermacentor silvarum]